MLMLNFQYNCFELHLPLTLFYVVFVENFLCLFMILTSLLLIWCHGFFGRDLIKIAKLMKINW